MSNPRRISIDLTSSTRETTTGKCVHCAAPTDFKIWRFHAEHGKGEFVFDCGCKFAQMKERIGL